MNGQRIGYRRVSSVDQNTARQLEGAVLERTFEDKASESPPIARACRQLSPTAEPATPLWFTVWIGWPDRSWICG
jgi:hypothetical protein